jgi:L-alanine-DL-glutamate epimerase-like enolase superfamily enzyme
MNGPYAHSGLNESFDRHTEVVAAVRKTLGPEIALMVDVQYMWNDAAGEKLTDLGSEPSANEV